MKTSREKQWAALRLALGNAQMFGAAVTAGLLILAGPTRTALVCLALTSSLTIASLCIFRDPWWRRKQ
jgi:hypothetical protein